MYNDFKIHKSNILDEVTIITPDIFNDSRGSLYTTFLKDKFEDLLPQNISFVHDKFAVSKKNVLRGIHGDFFSWKLISCVYGKIFQVVVDNRKDSKNYLKHFGLFLDGSSPKSVLIPPGFGNAFQVLSDNAVYNYKLAYSGDYRDADEQFTLKWNDERILIDWPNKNPILSDRDSIK